ncbi:hypothetical protein BKA67DRAFT_536975 [Truncatella angustata]|uniref:Uncharacterized protein n=1 Tax=Truncatella angustata TaxID=152316 RepID=A0A9P8UJ12_9PEZI|nr:uncharacterized protein BKA67DRAFT_536975 [Truncatella angustata]KAH6653288.1 hypothetical protein BKA67DRAFT_536975 [Truncatella angustata]
MEDMNFELVQALLKIPGLGNSYCGVIFILDKVMSACLQPNSLQGRYALEPDITTLSKYIGGGVVVGGLVAASGFFQYMIHVWREAFRIRTPSTPLIPKTYPRR